MKRTVVVIVVILLALLLALGAMISYVIVRLRAGSVPVVPAPSESATPIPEMYVLDVNQTPVPARDTPAPSYETATEDAQIVNILFIGGDSRSSTTSAIGNADTILLVSVNMDTRTITLLSFMRDSWLDIVTAEYTAKDKLSAAHSAGGSGALINTLNHNFHLDIQEYVAVGFENFTALIDAIGGIDVELTAKEAYYINWKMERNVLKVEDGTVHLDGEKALWYARNRTTPLAGDESGNDFSRVTRQQTLVELVLTKLRAEMNADMMFDLIRFAVENCTTNLSAQRMGEIGGFLLTNECAIQKARVPFDGAWSYRQAGGISFDVEQAAGEIHALLYPQDAP